jgi:glycerophosphoryl diester phosphodiesterase
MDAGRVSYPLRVPAPLLIAHRGACGYRPELTRGAFLLALQQGAQAIEVDVVASADGGLVVRHDVELSHTTDVATRADLRDRRRTKTVRGRPSRCSRCAR